MSRFGLSKEEILKMLGTANAAALEGARKPEAAAQGSQSGCDCSDCQGDELDHALAEALGNATTEELIGLMSKALMFLAKDLDMKETSRVAHEIWIES